MIALVVYTFAMAAAQTVEVRIAPDQPAPLFFTDEPLVIQVRADMKTSAAPEIEAELPDGRRVLWAPGTLALAPGSARWLTMEGLPVLRGPHLFRVRVTAESGPSERSLVRIDRPTPGGTHTAVFALSSASPALRYAAQCVGAGLQFPLEMPTLDAEIAAFNLPGRGPVYVRITASGGRHPRTIESAAAALGRRVDLWTVNGTRSTREVLREARAVSEGSPGANWAVRLEDARESAVVLALTSAHLPRALICAPAEAESHAEVAARIGIERTPLLIDFNGDAAASSPEGFLSLLLSTTLAPARTALIPQHLIETPEGFTGALAILSALRSQLAGAQSLGRSTSAGGNESWVFHLGPGASPETWSIVYIVRDAADPLPAIAPGDGATWEVLDAYGNVLDDTGRSGGTIALPAGNGAWYVRGHGGTLLREALAERVRALAVSGAANAGELAAVAPETVGSIEALTEYTLPAPARLHFFALLRALPALEEGWRRGLIETRVAIPMVRDFAAIAEVLAVLEQELDEPLLEPLDKTLDTCTEWLARYPATAGMDPQSARRLEFLRSEVARLTAAARAWDSAGRATEAKAVAAIAEWRARSLEAAATVAWPIEAPESLGDEVSIAEEAVVDGTPDQQPGPKSEEKL